MAYDSPIHTMRLTHIQSQPDEGYSEETQSITGEDLDAATRSNKPLSEAAQMILRGIESLPVEDRTGILRCIAGTLPTDQQLTFYKDVLYTLPTWAKQDVSSHLDSLMFFDPVRYFPYEIIQNIFDHLNPKDLLNASAVSHEWRLHTQDEELWRMCFKREGWRVDEEKIRHVEQAAKERYARYGRYHDALGFTRRDSKKRRLEEAFTEHNTVDLDRMEGIETSFSSAHTSPLAIHRGKERRRTSIDSTASIDSFNTVADTQFRVKPPVMQARVTASDDPRISWAYLYKQRRLLERNWDQGHHQMFRLPHPNYELEGHAECVYTIQHIGSILVSGSRDRTIRRWDLETCRLRGPPLHGHDASVLCLQFDPTPENDIIVSGGSDSWVIIWRFSTGEILKKMTTAHTESVLNLRFDDRYIVTCSKDKTIKIWNRRAIAVNDPILPTHVLPHFSNAVDMLIPEFTLLAKLPGHQAAVNAVMIHADRIVSASGDRMIKAWSIKTGKPEKTYSGHTKGIACVQYDGRRIVSGSSDNTVRIFDAEQQAEVACLQGHSNLVRTVQARFGDLEVTSDRELHEEARRADMKWSRAMAMGATPASGSRSSRRNAGSSRPEEMLTVGARVPPGGGGTRWARIVSGSYDETVIIWRKDQDGKWIARHKLHQDMLSRHRVRMTRPPAPPPSTTMPGAFPPQNALNAHTIPDAALSVPTQEDNTTTTTTTSTTDQASTTTFTTQATAGTSTPSHSEQDERPTRPQPATRASLQQMQTLHSSMQAPPRESNRVFKLQFDVRRIVCCSQNKVIVGWDFANGNEELAKVGNWFEETY